jgi:cation diffusion facilitator family transporter
MDYTRKRKLNAAKLSIASNSLLIVIKVIAGIISGSVSILSEAAHSGADLMASLIATFSVSVSDKPADQRHPYGHGKIENISGVLEGLLIFAAAALIIVEAVKKIIHPEEIQITALPITVMAVSAVVNFFVSRHLYKVAREEDSIALEADALHLKTDVYTSIGVCVGLIMIRVTGFAILDPIVAIAVALLIVREAWHLSSAAFSPLLDSSLSDEEEKIISEILNRHFSEDFHFCNLRTRKSGSRRFIDFNARVSPNMPIKKATEMTKHVEQDIEECIPNVSCQINVQAMDECPYLGEERSDSCLKTDVHK